MAITQIIDTTYLPTSPTVPYSNATGAVDLNSQDLTNVASFGASTATITNTIKAKRLLIGGVQG